ncbi:MAG: trypsin-like serine protease [Rhodospirillales bacterium]
MSTRVATAVGVAGVAMALELPAAFAEGASASPGGSPAAASAGGVTRSPVSRQKPGQGIDFANAIPAPLPQGYATPTPVTEAIAKSAQAALSAQAASLTPPRSYLGRAGSGKLTPVTLVPQDLLPGAPAAGQAASGRTAAPSADTVAPQEFGTQGLPYTTSQVNASGDDTDVHYPFAPIGKLFFNNQFGQTFVCSASLIARGLAVTAAHCVADFGTGQFYSNWQFVPAYNNGIAPFGVSTTKTATALSSYLDGTDACAQAGVVCQDDVAILTLNTVDGVNYIGSSTGWLGVGANGYGFTPWGTTQVTQVGYPVGLDDGELMERNDAFGYTDASMANNTLIGSLMTGGSSGGPWVLNLGMPPTLTGTNFGEAAVHNIVIGVTSWGTVADEVKLMGASPFTSANIFTLISAACTATPAACQ